MDALVRAFARRRRLTRSGAEALDKPFQPVKMNFSGYSNAELHVHWHLVPRYDDDRIHGKTHGKK